MAQFIAQTNWFYTFGDPTTFTIPLSHTATAGDKLIFTSNGGAISTPSGFAERTTYGGGNEDASVWEKDAVGGETSISVSLNGSGSNVSGVVFELGPGLTFVAASNNGHSTVADISNDFAISPTSAVTLSTGKGLLIGIFAATNSTPWSTENSMRSFGPTGKLFRVGGNTPGFNEEFNFAVGMADVDHTQSWPPQASAGNFQATTVYSPGSAICTCAQVLFADTSGVTTVALPPTKTAQENLLPGTHLSNWFLGDDGTDDTIAGYTDFCSYGPGDTVNFQVDSGNHAFRVEIYRAGFYGYETFAARNVLGPQIYIAGTPAVQATPDVDSTLGSTSCAWTTTASWTIPSTAQSGLYYYLLRRTDTGGHISSGHFVVRATSVTNKMVVIIPDQTHQAYNRWGATTDVGTTASGSSLYATGTDGGTWVFGHRAYSVNFNRPYSVQSDRDVTYLFDSTYVFIVFAEAQGYEICYVSDMDVHRDPTILQGAAMTVLAGHAEYWTKNTYDGILNSINSYGINMLDLSSNTALWRTRFDSADTDFRNMICYKDSGTEDVGSNTSLPGSGFDPVEYTGTWRDTRQVPGVVNNPDIRRENVFGQLFRVSGHFVGQAEIDFAHKTMPCWRHSLDVQALTTGQTYQCPIVSIGDETDSPDGSVGQPSNMVLLFSQPGIAAILGANDAGTIYDSHVTITVAWTMAQTSGGAIIVSTGNWRGHNPIGRWRTASTALTSGGVDLNFQNSFLCLLYDMGQTPTTLTSMQPGVDSDPTDPAIGAPTRGNSSVGKAYGLLEPIVKVDWKFNQAATRASFY